MGNEKREPFARRLTRAMEIMEIKPVELADKSGCSAASISQWMGGLYEAKQNAIHALSKALNVSEGWLMGFDVPMERNPSSDMLVFDNIFPIGTKRHPLLGDIACGQPILATEQFESYVIAGADITADFCLRCKGDSMKNARIHDGDIVFVRKQPMVENGEIAAVVIDNEATLKRVYYHQADGVLTLVSENPAFPPLVYTGNELNKVIILGKAVAFQSDVK